MSAVVAWPKVAPLSAGTSGACACKSNDTNKAVTRQVILFIAFILFGKVTKKQRFMED